MSINIHVSNGQVFDLYNLPAQRPVRTVFTRALSMLNRYAGQTVRPYSVAEHTCLLAEHPEVIAAGLCRAALLHDFSEALMVDVPSPIKNLMPRYLELEGWLQKTIFDWWDEPFENLYHFNEFDKRICVDEMQALFLDPPAPWVKPLGDVSIPIVEQSWMHSFRRLEGLCNLHEVAA